MASTDWGVAGMNFEYLAVQDGLGKRAYRRGWSKGHGASGEEFKALWRDARRKMEAGRLKHGFSYLRGLEDSYGRSTDG